MKILFGFFLFLIVNNATTQNSSIIPEPVSVTTYPGYYNFGPSSYFHAKDLKSYTEAYAANFLFINYHNLPIKTVDKQISELTGIILQYDSTLQIPDGGYILKISQNAISITGKNNGGVFSGLMSLLQLVENNGENNFRVPCIEIIDYPRFEYRGMHLDCSRHFFSVDFIKEYIDYLALYKFNTFHWHLTDDQGWRIEIKQYPKLTEIGAWRDGTMVGHYRDQKYDSEKYGGYYTQADIKLIVKYAAARNITIIPEIEMPGHCGAALAAYPELGCVDDTVYTVTKGWGIFPELFCPKEETFVFLENVLTEVMDLFPSEYIHIGGDEAEKRQWEKCKHCQKLIKENNLVDEHGLQSYFINRIETFVNSKGRKIIGWDEILEGGLESNATIMSWRGEEGGIAAAKQKQNAIMTPTNFCYFDYYQGSPAHEPIAIGGFTTLEKVYHYEPIPSVLSPGEQKYILGAQGNLWTEYIKTPEHVEYMIFPRMLALSEVLWTQKKNKNYSEFIPRVLSHFILLDKVNCNYARSIFRMQYSLIPDANFSGIIFKPISDPYLGRYSFGIKYEGAHGENKLINNGTELFLTTSATVFLQYENAQETLVSVNFNKATGKQIILESPASKKYPGSGAFTLVDGIAGNTEKGWSGNEWLGFLGTYLHATIDLGKLDTITKISTGFLSDKLSWIYPSNSFEVFISDDGNKYRSIGKTKPELKEGARIESTISIEPVVARYVRIIAENYGKIPAGNPGAGTNAWLFVDEIVIN